MSDGILRFFEARDPGSKMLGYRWLPEARSMPRNALASKVSCERHNSGLSRLDDAALLLVKAIYTDVEPGENQHWLFSGHDIERWLIQRAAAVIFSNNSGDNKQPINSERVNRDAMVDALIYNKWAPGGGLYIMDPKPGSNWELAPLILNVDHLGYKSKHVFGYRCTLGPVGFAVVWDPIGEAAGVQFICYRPNNLVFDWYGTVNNIELSWNPGQGGDSYMTFVGSSADDVP